ncbi:hypothetical protein F5878DRAFT_645856, partial [Lentinula raphanica]
MPKRSASGSTATKKARKRTKRPHDSESDNNEGLANNSPNISDNDRDNDRDDDVVDTTEQIKAAREAAIKQTRKELTKRKSPVYAFFHAEPGMEFGESNDKPDYLVYQCTNC